MQITTKIFWRLWWREKTNIQGNWYHISLSCNFNALWSLKMLDIFGKIFLAYKTLLFHFLIVAGIQPMSNGYSSSQQQDKASQWEYCCKSKWLAKDDIQGELVHCYTNLHIHQFIRECSRKTCISMSHAYTCIHTTVLVVSHMWYTNIPCKQ